jgi:hypothetical protein
MAPKFEDRLIVVIKQGGIVERAFDAADGIINKMTITLVFSYYKLKSYREIDKEQ